MFETINKDTKNTHLLYVLSHKKEYFADIFARLERCLENYKEESLLLNDISNKEAVIQKEFPEFKSYILKSVDKKEVNLFMNKKDKNLKLKFSFGKTVSLCIGLNKVYLEPTKSNIVPESHLVKSIFTDFTYNTYTFNILKEVEEKQVGFANKKVWVEEKYRNDYFDLNFICFSKFLEDGSYLKDVEDLYMMDALLNDDSNFMHLVFKDSAIMGIIKNECLKI